MADDLAPAERRAQAHVELSPVLWHIGHVFFVENYWLAEYVFGDQHVTDRWRRVYFPEQCPKQQRSFTLPSLDELKKWADEVSEINDHYWQQIGAVCNPILEDNYLHAFIRQHYAQHLETMRLARHQLDIGSGVQPTHTMPSRPPDTTTIQFMPTTVVLGNEDTVAYDNEKPSHYVDIDGFAIGKKPVTNAEWLGFMCAGGYDDKTFWTAEGWAWRCANHINRPQHWLIDQTGALQISNADPEIPGEDPVHGISWYEAVAFAHYAGARLPSEAEWETARRSEKLDCVGQVWEWCRNAFYPYPGFRAYPYDGYSNTWFDGAHMVARGGSRLTEPEIRRPTFRNFYPPTHRHIYAGLRLAWH